MSKTRLLGLLEQSRNWNTRTSNMPNMIMSILVASGQFIAQLIQFTRQLITVQRGFIFHGAIPARHLAPWPRDDRYCHSLVWYHWLPDDLVTHSGSDTAQHQ